MKRFISRGTVVSLFLFVLTSVDAQEPNKQPLPSAPAKQTTSKRRQVSVPFEEKLLGTKPPEYEDLAFAGLVGYEFQVMKRHKTQISFRAAPPAVVCFPPNSKDFDFPKGSPALNSVESVNSFLKSFKSFVGNHVGRLPHGGGLTLFGTPANWAFVASQHGKVFVVINNKKGPEFDAIGMPFGSPDLSTFGYIAIERDPAGSKAFLVLGNKTVPLQHDESISLDSNPSSPRYSPPFLSLDNSKVAYISSHKEKQKEAVAVIEGNWGDPAPATIKYGPEFDSVSEPVLSPDGTTVAYAASEAKKSFIVAGDKKGPEFDEVFHAVFSPDGTTVAYDVEDKQNKKMFIVVGDKKGPEFEWVGRPVFSPDGSAVGYQAAEEKEKEFVVVAGRRGPKFDHVLEPLFSPDGKTVAYGAQNGRKQFVVVGDEKGPEFDSVDDLRFSPDGSTVAYVVHEGKKEFMVVGEKRGPEFDGVFPPFFSPDGSKVAYGARLGREFWWKVMSVR